MDVLVTIMMKNVVKCDNICDMHSFVSHYIFERTLRFPVTPGSAPA